MRLALYHHIQSQGKTIKVETSMFSLFNRFPAQLTQWILAGLLVPIVALNVWLLFKAVHLAQPLVSILVSAALLAFLLNYPVQLIQKWGLDRKYAVTSVVVMFFGLLIGASITILPQSSEELGEFISALPTRIQSTQLKLQILQDWAMQHHIPIRLNQWTAQFTDGLPDRIHTLGNNAVNLIFSALGSASNLALTGIFTVYLLFDGSQLWNGIAQRLPSQKIAQIQRSLQQHFEDYFTGQAIMAIVSIVALTVVFLILRIPFPLLLGLFIGTLSIFPFGATLASFISALLIAADDPGLGLWLLGSSIVTNQAIDQLITPRLMGKLVGLRPFWILLALLVGAKLGGLIGVIIAVPIASCLKDILQGFPSSVSSSDALPAAPVPSEIHS
ncbi:AI-2E family transporter [Cyanobacteria bacterium FACHB-DQ100]|nr:AI-2E family transporter [Cyanobacteria bacterium FACHB-DQ100]